MSKAVKVNARTRNFNTTVAHFGQSDHCEEDNYGVLMTTITADINSWSALNMSCTGMV